MFGFGPEAGPESPAWARLDRVPSALLAAAEPADTRNVLRSTSDPPGVIEARRINQVNMALGLERSVAWYHPGRGAAGLLFG